MTPTEAVTIDLAIDNPVTEVPERSTSTETDPRTDPTVLSASARKIGIQNPQLGTQSKPNVNWLPFSLMWNCLVNSLLRCFVKSVKIQALS